MMQSHTDLGIATQSSTSLFAMHSASKKGDDGNDTQLKLHVRKSKTEICEFDVFFVITMRTNANATATVGETGA
jgi:hypothetical protein